MEPARRRSCSKPRDSPRSEPRLAVCLDVTVCFSLKKLSSFTEMGEPGDFQLRLLDAAEHDRRQNVQRSGSVSGGAFLTVTLLYSCADLVNVDWWACVNSFPGFWLTTLQKSWTCPILGFSGTCQSRWRCSMNAMPRLLERSMFICLAARGEDMAEYPQSLWCPSGMKVLRTLQAPLTGSIMAPTTPTPPG